MKVIGIDPAPKKETTIYNAEGWLTVEAHKLPDYVAKIAESDGGHLVCWDAPLTSGKAGMDGCYYNRPIERFLRKLVPEGISVLAYAGCPHWAVTRAAVGLPRVGRFDCTDLPFTLCAEGRAPENNGNLIVEVHPAVAIWFWCLESGQTKWKYKTDHEVREHLWHTMAGALGEFKPNRDPKDDDEFDAYVAYLLGSMWLANSGVILLGRADTGSFLVPAVDGFAQAFAQYCEPSPPG